MCFSVLVCESSALKFQEHKIWKLGAGVWGAMGYPHIFLWNCPHFRFTRFFQKAIYHENRGIAVLSGIFWHRGRATPYIWNDEHQHICVKSCVYTAFQVNKFHWLHYVYLIITAPIGWGKNEDKVLKSLRQTPEKNK